MNVALIYKSSMANVRLDRPKVPFFKSSVDSTKN